ncbi:MAG: hypothetical protein JWS12_928 [Candidatus Saccharibacteria bacterium]|nr:hypothetical protein [Candidatus Saccharibacteria bacterium]
MPRRGNIMPRGSLPPSISSRTPGLGAFHALDFESQEDSNVDFSAVMASLEANLEDAHGFKTHQHNQVAATDPKPPAATHGHQPRAKLPVKLYHPEHMRLKVLERRLSKDYAQQHRLYWNKNDMGQIRGEIANSLARLEMSHGPFEVVFTGIARVGDAEKNEYGGRKLAFVPEVTSAAAEFLCDEHEICVDGLSKRLSRFRYPYDEYMAKQMFARVDRREPESVVRDVIDAAHALLPVTVTYLPLEFYANQSFRA